MKKQKRKNKQKEKPKMKEFKKREGWDIVKLPDGSFQWIVRRA